MSSWSRNRKLSYGIVVLIIIIAALGIPSFYLFYHPPSCFDGVKNGDEQGVDCGGSCQKLCASSFLPPSVAWTRFEQVAPQLYNIGAYIVNPNVDGEATGTPYHLALYDNQGMLITDITGTVTLPPHRNTLAFKGAVNVNKRVPAKALFEFTNTPNWHTQADTLKNLVVADKKYGEDSQGSSLVVTLGNAGILPIGRTTVYAILYDKDGNAIGFSRTVVDQIPSHSTVIAPFTWPTSFNGAVISEDVLPVAE